MTNPEHLREEMRRMIHKGATLSDAWRSFPRHSAMAVEECYASIVNERPNAILLNLLAACAEGDPASVHCFAMQLANESLPHAPNNVYIVLDRGPVAYRVTDDKVGAGNERKAMPGDTEVGRYSVYQAWGDQLWYVSACAPDFLSVGFETRSESIALAKRLAADDPHVSAVTLTKWMREVLLAIRDRGGAWGIAMTRGLIKEGLITRDDQSCVCTLTGLGEEVAKTCG